MHFLLDFKKTSFLFAVLFLFFRPGFAQTISFPGADGAGKFTTGGRGTAAVPTTVFEVTNLTDVNTPGSLRYACSQSTVTYPHRTIVFRVSGTIHLGAKLNVPKNTTIAGQTAPGGGICMADYPVVISGDNVIIRYVRFRMGDKNQLKTTPSNCGVPVAPFTAACQPLDGSGGDDALGNLGNKNLMIDHCSVSWSNDEALTVYRGDSITLQWNLISEPLNYSYHFENGDADFEHHGYGGIWGAKHGSFHHNLFAHCKSRNPRFSGSGNYLPGEIESCDFRNNVIYNWELFTVYGGEGGQYNLVNNYYKFGPSTGSSNKYRIVNVDSNSSFGFARYYLSGNYVDGSTSNTANNWLGAYMLGGNAADTLKSKVAVPFLSEYSLTNVHSAADAYDSVLANVGAILPRRDTLDQRIIRDVKYGTGKLIDVQGGFAHGTAYPETVNAWPNLQNETAPADVDHDGMTDEWEIANGLNPNNAGDRGIIDETGYTNLERYLNSISATVTAPAETSAANATWPLLAQQMPVTLGEISASNQVLGSYLAGTSYGSTFGTVSGWQRVGTTSYLPIGYNSNSYVEYKLAPSPGKKFTATAIELSALGGGTGTARMLCFYSLDNFITAIPVGTTTYNNISYAGTDTLSSVSLLNTSTATLTGQQIATAATNITVLPTQTLSLRVYVWITGSGSRYFPSQNVKIDGFTSSATGDALPLSLLHFSAAANAGSTILQWKTSKEMNLQFFELEKSRNGAQFSAIGKIAALNTMNENSYSFTDDLIRAPVNYYRLKMLDKNGSFRYSNIIAVNGKLTRKISIYPNPAAEAITINHNRVAGKGMVVITDLEGRKIKTIPLSHGTTQTSVNCASLFKGIYILKYSDANTTETIRFFKM